MPHFPITLNVGGQRISLHGLLEALGIFIAFRYYLYLKRKTADEISSENRIWIIIAATLGAVIGARILGSLENIPEWAASLNKVQYFWGNKTLVGGLLGGLFSVEGVKLIIKEKGRSGDLFVFPLLLGMMIGRLGCFSAGIEEETYGLPTKLPWAMDLGDGMMRHPVTLYEIVFLMLLWIALAWMKSRYQLASGALFKMFMMAYLFFRFCLDFIKPGWRYFFGLGSIQIACLLGLLYYHRHLLHPKLLLDDIAGDSGRYHVPTRS